MNEGALLSGADLSDLPEEGLVVVAFSGGADSTALAHWLSCHIQKERILLAHVNHMLRGEEADRDEAAARAFAQAQGLRFSVLRADVKALSRERRQGLEECGREVRYGFFASLALGEGDRILTAHNADDNAETVLLNLCRGASLQGLCGIPRQRGKILRPFLGVTREQIEAYCRFHGLSYVTDSTNLSDAFSRNRLRHQVIPVLRELNPRFEKAVFQTTRILSRDRAFLRQEEQALLDRARGPYGLRSEILLGAPDALRFGAVKQYLEEAGCGELSQKHLEEACRILSKGGGAILPGRVSVKCAQGVFFALKMEEQPPFSVPVFLGETALPNGKTLVLRKKSLGKDPKIHNLLFKKALDYDIINGNLIARTRREGDRFAPMGRGVSKSLKQLFQEMGVPAELRSRMLLLESGGELAFCEGAGPSQGFRITGRTKTALIVEIRE